MYRGFETGPEAFIAIRSFHSLGRHALCNGLLLDDVVVNVLLRGHVLVIDTLKPTFTVLHGLRHAELIRFEVF